MKLWIPFTEEAQEKLGPKPVGNPTEIRAMRGECRWEKDGTPVGIFPGKYEWAGDTGAGDCSLRILAAKYEYDNGAWVCQVTASSFRERDTLISHPANLVVRGESDSVCQ